jgi:hypothetical protein
MLLLVSLHTISVESSSSCSSLSAINGNAGFLWTATHDFILPILKALPYSRDWLWVLYVDIR